ncbi:DNA N-6-adenine-methyltransferase [Marinobacterium stanieri]|uniref:DNA N-6-adenine-methyltransferase (Dam) n=1 Tax=Marinobacterium stanieri TaxID=49186 RepID=A0A1N6QCG9_9GAMM|nr:DNA N-6-adenine-methyltransferase [Marinobacterium stanieri]SIQ14215.1 DNA N-6-adenine-methyltransferase (Dam) [Marinobacterium stanieri]
MSGFFGTEVVRSPIKSVEWYTPQWVFDALGLQFDLDPSSPHDMETAVPANTKYTVFDDGLSKQWHGRVWLNPPYGKETPAWMGRMIDHGHGIALVFSRTDTTWCQAAMRSATAMLFIQGRIQFVPGHENQHKKSRSGAGTVMFAWGDDCASALEKMSDRGVYIRNTGSAAA